MELTYSNSKLTYKMGCSTSALVLETSNGGNIISIPALDYHPDPFGMGYAFFKAMQKNRDSVAQVDAISGESESYADLLPRCIRTALEMKSRNITDQDIICICSVNHFNNVVPFIATLFLGAKIASLDPNLPLSDTVHLIRQVTPKMIFVSAAAEQMIEEAIRETALSVELVVFGESNKYETFKEFSSVKLGEDDFEPFKVADLKETSIILFSSGTTGLAKGICINHYAMMMQANNFKCTGLNTNVLLGFASTYWISTVLFITLAVLNGKVRVICPKFNAKEVWSLLEKSKATLMFGAPSQAVAMVKIGSDDINYDMSSLEDFVIGGGPLDETHLLALREMLPKTRIHLAYGQTECAGIMTIFNVTNNVDLELIKSKIRSCGKGLPGFDYKIVDPESGEVQPIGQSGELQVKTKYTMNGYYKVDSTSCWDENGWLHTGDVAFFDEDQCIYVIDRIKEMLKFQSYHVIPAKIEGVLGSHPAVNVAVVIGILHDEDGDHPMAVVVRKHGAQVTEDELVAYVEERVDDRHRLRAGVKFVEDVPYTPSGKVQKGLLKKLMLDGKL